jgi:CRP/FNR family transcriptional regulator, polysaccharide utilization system transcription regulator
MSRCEQCIVRELSALKALSKEELIGLSEVKTSQKLNKGEFLFDEGVYLDGLYCLKNGMVKITKLGENGKDHIVKLMSKGEIVGHRSIINEEATNLNAIAMEETEMCFIPKNEVMRLIKSNSNFSIEMMKSICTDLKVADDHLVDMAQKTVKQRLAETLLYFENKFGTDKEGYLKVVISREELAGLIGTATESCIRLLSELKKNNLIEIASKKIKILNQLGLSKVH